MGGAANTSHLERPPLSAFTRTADNKYRTCNPITPLTDLRNALRRQKQQKVISVELLEQLTWNHPDDDGFSKLTMSDYITYRLNSCCKFFGYKTKRISLSLHVLQILVYLFGALSTTLSIVGQNTWMPLTAAFVAALTSMIDFGQYEVRLARANQAATDLKNVLSWWKGLPAGDMLKASTRAKMLKIVEDIISNEMGWSATILDDGEAAEKEKEKQEKRKKEKEDKEDLEGSDKEEEGGGGEGKESSKGAKK
jgi:hypothetical protein